MSKSWTKGNVGRFWEDEYKKFIYTKKTLYTPTGELQDPKSYGWIYDNSNPMPDWTKNFKKIFNLKNPTYTFYKMLPGEIMPTHADHYERYIKIFDAKYENMCRVVVMLEDWKPGHYFEIDGQGIVNWVTGDYFLWKSDTPHAAANAGLEDRYTLQITGEQFAFFNDWSKLHYFNIPNLNSRIESSHEMLKHIKKPVKDKIKPLYIYCNNQKIEDLEKINHDEKTVKQLNMKGIDFYLYEPLCSYYTHRPKKSMGFYSEFRYRADGYKGIRSEELDSIAEYARRNQLCNITVYTGDYGVNEIYGDAYPELKLVTDDIYLKIPPHWPARQNPESADKFTKKFISTNWRYTIHRHLITAYLSQLESNISWCYKGDIKLIFFKDGWIDSGKWSTANPEQHSKFLKGMIYLNEYAPINLDYKIKLPTLVTDTSKGFLRPTIVQSQHPNDPNSKSNSDNIEKFYNDSFCDVVSESRFAQPTGNYSEKAYQPMYYKKPFVMVAPPKTLEYMKQHGFKTFDKFWDESYDNEYHHHTRMLTILDVIDHINSKSIDELKDMYKDMQDILEHNYNLFQEKVGRIYK